MLLWGRSLGRIFNYPETNTGDELGIVEAIGRKEHLVIDNRRIAAKGRQYFVAAVIAFVVFSVAGVAIADSLVLKSQGSFFVGGRTISTDALTGTSSGFLNTEINTGSITVDQMYVQYQIPESGEKRLPVVMVHGCCLSATSYG